MIRIELASIDNSHDIALRRKKIERWLSGYGARVIPSWYSTTGDQFIMVWEKMVTDHRGIRLGYEFSDGDRDLAMMFKLVWGGQ